MRVKVDIEVQKILTKYGLGQSDAFRRELATNVRRRCDKYVPFKEGYLKDTAQVSGDGRTITYIQPYAKKQYTIPYKHSDHLRGEYWDKRMIANEKAQLAEDMDTYVKGRGK